MWGWPQILVAFFAFVSFGATTACFVTSKLTLLSLWAAASSGIAQGGAHPDAAAVKLGHQALVLVVGATFIPHAWAFVLSVWKTMYKASQRNPWPSVHACGWTVLLTLCEVVGVLSFSFMLAPRLASAENVVVMMLVFSSTLLSWARKPYRNVSDDTELLVVRGPAPDPNADFRPSATQVRGRFAGVLAGFGGFGGACLHACLAEGRCNSPLFGGPFSRRCTASPLCSRSS